MSDDVTEFIKRLELKIEELESELSICIEIIEESGVDYDEIIQAYTGD